MVSFSALMAPALLLRILFLASDPEVRPPAGSETREAVQEPADESLPRFGEDVFVDELPEVVTRVPPRYPEGVTIEGTVLIQALVGKAGHVKDTRVVKSIPALDRAAEEAVRQWMFKPALAEGKPVAVWVAIPVRFSRQAARADSLCGLFDLAVAELQVKESRPPSETDAMLRERIIRLALDLREIATALEAAGRRADAAIALELYLVAEPRIDDWEAVRLKLGALRVTSGPRSSR